MNGAEALRYARSRHGSNDFDRGARQQRVLLSLREQADPQDLIPRIPELINALKSAVSTDIPTNQLAPLLGLASQVDTKNIRSYVFAPPFYCERHLRRPARLRRPAEDQPDQGRGEDGVHGRPGRRGAAPDAGPGGAPGCGSSTARATRAAARDRRGLPRLPRRPRLGAAPEAAGRGPGEHDDRRLQRRRGPACRRRSPTSSRRSG